LLEECEMFSTILREQHTIRLTEVQVSKKVVQLQLIVLLILYIVNFIDKH